jgi:membrane protease subunit (stomatin/prohibitin family)
MIGGMGYMAGKSGQRSANREDDQEQRLEALEGGQQTQAAAPAATVAPAASTDLVSRLKELATLKDSGALSQQEFDAAKAKLLAG